MNTKGFLHSMSPITVRKQTPLKYSVLWKQEVQNFLFNIWLNKRWHWIGFDWIVNEKHGTVNGDI